ncbi:aryl-sulfate sulfotransferase [Shewanella surugensis]|uniref:Aryl-sulfate sulfotransferase n=1 Tax=Shewanella surugensis TaxID=212020 RepID=A0ABT0LBK9_9GAMM|nr:aryl-sulfate sulfotransferase [Shewanella surugensis]MCL1124750.1 aryl-sulfate sulfotransferase [Shewanella surugensis]
MFKSATKTIFRSVLFLGMTCGLASESVLAADLDEYTLFAPNGSTDTYLIDKDGNTVHSWVSDHRVALSVYLLPSGELLRTGSVLDAPATFSGNAGGMVEILDWESNVVWEAAIASDNYFSHHDAEVLPNGNILVLAWEAKTAEEAMALGRTQVAGDTLWADAVYEICRESEANACLDGEIVWRWSTWDHAVQDVDTSISSNYVNNVADHPDKVNLNYFSGDGSADWTHANSVDYHPEKDVIVISVHNFNEYWIIDHSDASAGIVYRSGNPLAYDQSGRQTLFGQHDVQWIEPGLPGEGNILLFNNGFNRPVGEFSTVDELCYEANCRSGSLLSQYSEGVNGEFYSSHISGAQRLPNGNTLVCEGRDGHFFEYNIEHEIVWEFNYDGSVFRAYRYYGDYSGLSQLVL